MGDIGCDKPPLPGRTWVIKGDCIDCKREKHLASHDCIGTQQERDAEELQKGMVDKSVDQMQNRVNNPVNCFCSLRDISKCTFRML
jgi:hypothetical protein